MFEETFAVHVSGFFGVKHLVQKSRKRLIPFLMVVFA